jgi:hypothetical protein
MHSLLKKMQKNTFFERNFIQKLKLLFFLNLVDVYQYHTPKKIRPKIPSMP